MDLTIVSSPNLERVEVESIIRRPDGTLFMRAWGVIQDTFSDTEQERPHSYAAVLEELQGIAEQIPF